MSGGRGRVSGGRGRVREGGEGEWGKREGERRGEG